MKDRAARKRVAAIAAGLTEAEKEALRRYRINTDVVPGEDHHFTFNSLFYAQSLRLLDEHVRDDLYGIEGFEKLSIEQRCDAVCRADNEPREMRLLVDLPGA